MDKFKICPVCGAKNNPQFLECSECEADLQNVPVADDSAERIGPAADTPSDPVTMVRVCDCGAQNPVHLRVCSVCGEDISMIVPTAQTESAPCRYVLSSLDGAYAFEVTEGTTVIGREHEMREYLASKPYVSRKHAVLTLDSANGTLRIQNCNTTNYTFVNNEMLSADGSTDLKDGDEIGLGGNVHNGTRQNEAAYFTVRIGECT